MTIDEASEDVRERALRFSLLDENLNTDNIYDLFADLRDQCPVAPNNGPDGRRYLVTRHADIDQVLRDSSAFITGMGSPPNSDKPRWLPHDVDPPLHRLFRRDLNVMFSEAQVKLREAAMTEQVRQYLEPIVARGRGELVRELTTPFPCVTFLLMLGAPLSDLDLLIEAKDTMIVSNHDLVARARLTNELYPRLMEYFGDLLDQRLAAGDDAPADVLTGLVRANVGDRPMTRDEQIRVCGFLVLAGLDTVTGTWSRILRFLAENPQHRAALANDRSLIPDAIEEMLRYFSIVSMNRYVAKDIELGGQALKEGDTVDVFTQSAGRDERAYECPHKIDFHRENLTHLAFGGGVHRCMGSHLARMELRVGMEAVMAMMPDFRLDPERPPREHIGSVFGVDELHVIVGS